MNKYIIPIVDMEAGIDHLEIIHANSLKECKDKLMDNLLTKYDFLDDDADYNKFLLKSFNEGIYICNIVDIETI